MSSISGRLAPNGSLTLFCLAHAGGSALPYTRWTDLPPGVRIEPLELPGHGSRLREPLRQTMDDLVAELLPRLRAVEGPFALFGHSFGALLGYEVARRLERSGQRPAALLVAGRNGPTRPLSHRPIHALPEDAFLRGLRRFGGLPEALLDQPELLRMYLPVLRCDLRIVETYTRSAGPPLTAPVVALAGRRDVLTDAPGMLAWERETLGTFDLSLLPGGHFFLDTPEFTATLNAALSRHALPATAPAAGQLADRPGSDSSADRQLSSAPRG